MKDSGIEWIGNIPNDWKIYKIGSLFKSRNEKVSDTDYPPLSVSKGGVVPQMEGVAKSDASDNRKLVLAKDFVINSRSDRKQSCGFSSLDGSVSLINTVLYTDNSNIILPEYTNIVMKNYGFAEEFYRWGHGIVADLWATRWQEMKNIVLSIPSIDKQKKILCLLSSKLERIDNLIANQQTQIEKLKEYKQTIICENVQSRFANSGKQIKLKYICASQNSNISAGELVFDKSNTPVYGAAGIMGYTSLSGCEKEYLGIIKDGTGVGRVNIYPKNSLLLGTMAYIMPKSDVDLSWLKYTIMSLRLSESLDKTTIPHIYFKDYGNETVLYIKEELQRELVLYLDEKCAHVDKLILLKQEKIEKLQEYKKSLIYEYVTGKKEVV